MAIVELGTRQLNIGDTPVAYSAFDFKADSAYMIEGSFLSPNLSKVFSNVLIRSIINNNEYTDTFSHHIITLPVVRKNFLLLFPFSNLYQSDGQVTLQVERLSFVQGGGDQEPNLELSLKYDDKNTEKTWL